MSRATQLHSPRHVRRIVALLATAALILLSNASPVLAAAAPAAGHKATSGILSAVVALGVFLALAGLVGAVRAGNNHRSSANSG